METTVNERVLAVDLGQYELADACSGHVFALLHDWAMYSYAANIPLHWQMLTGTTSAATRTR
jgi:hypothetical protein